MAIAKHCVHFQRMPPTSTPEIWNETIRLNIDVEKVGTWRNLHVHGVSLDRYINEGVLDLARGEVEVMAGPLLRYAPRA